MITSSRIGKWGRLGNQLFQYAALAGVAHRRGLEAKVPPLRQHELASVIDVCLPTYTTEDLHHIQYRFIQTDASTGYEPGLETIPDRCDVVGLFQSRRHFPPDDRARALLAFRADVQAEADDVWRTLETSASGRPVIGLMVRRGDFVGNPNFCDLWADGYYDRALAHVDKGLGLDPLFLVTSDDVAWSEAHLDLRRAVFPTALAPPTQLAVLARCDHLILANSTFSWWAWWYWAHGDRAGDGVTIAPARWFAPDGGLDDTERDRGEAWVEL